MYLLKTGVVYCATCDCAHFSYSTVNKYYQQFIHSCRALYCPDMKIDEKAIEPLRLTQTTVSFVADSPEDRTDAQFRCTQEQNEQLERINIQSGLNSVLKFAFDQNNDLGVGHQASSALSVQLQSSKGMALVNPLLKLKPKVRDQLWELME